MGSNPYESPLAPATSTPSPSSGPNHQTHGRAITVALVQQIVIIVLAALVLDGGVILRAVAAALAISWIVSLAVLSLHRKAATLFSLAIVKYGFWIAILAVIVNAVQR